MTQLVLTLNVPVSSNRYWATRVAGKRAMTYVTKEALAYRRHVQEVARAAGVVDPIRGRVQIEVWFYPHRPLDWQKRQRMHGALWDDTVQALDADNVAKTLLDSLKDVVMEDDKFVRRLMISRMEPDDKPARVVVRITAIDVPKPQLTLEGTAS